MQVMTIPAALNVDDKPHLPSYAQDSPASLAGTSIIGCGGIAEAREPYNSASHNLRSLQMTLTACRSANAGDQPVAFEEVSA
jgi:hypothetical protein